MSMVRAGSIVHCEVTSVTSLSDNADGVVNQVSSLLAQSGYGTRNASASVGVTNVTLSGGWGYSFQASLDVQVPTDFGDPNDVLSIVQNAFYQVTGSLPTAATVTSVTAPGGTAQSTGLPGLSSSGIGGTSGDSSIGNVFSGVASLGSNLLIGLAVLVLAILLIVGFAPNTGRVAGAFA